MNAIITRLSNGQWQLTIVKNKSFLGATRHFFSTYSDALNAAEHYGATVR